MAVDQYAVMGNPIAHSKSPHIHQMFAEQTGESLEYRAILVDLDEFKNAIISFAEENGRGLNITVPFKQQAFDLATTLSDRAGRAGAVNTLIFRDDGGLHGDNTDGIGMIRDITENHGITLAGKRILVLGAGGAVRGVLAPLMAENPAIIHIANRTTLRAQELIDQFQDLAEEHEISLGAGGFETTPAGGFDFIINGTAAGLHGEVPPIKPSALAASGSCYDMMYASEPTAFVRWGREQGAQQSLDGLGMLVEQAAESFYLWRGVRPITRNVIKSLRDL